MASRSNYCTGAGQVLHRHAAHQGSKSNAASNRFHVLAVATPRNPARSGDGLNSAMRIERPSAAASGGNPAANRSQFHAGSLSETSARQMGDSMGQIGSSTTSDVDRRVAIATIAACGSAVSLRQRLQVGDEAEAPPTPKAQQLWSDERFAATMRDGMRDYERRIEPVKKELFESADLKGKDVVEIGLGSGPSIPLYSRLGVKSLVGVEPNLAMHDMARQTARECQFGQERLRIVPGFAEKLPLEDCSADVVVCSMLLCSVSDVAASIAEIKRVLKPGGRYVFVEHIAAPRGSVLRAMQTVFDPLQQTCACGCHLARDPCNVIRGAGWQKLDAQYFTLGQTLDEATRALDASNHGWRPSDGMPPPHFLLSPHLGGIAYKGSS